MHDLFKSDKWVVEGEWLSIDDNQVLLGGFLFSVEAFYPFRVKGNHLQGHDDLVLAVLGLKPNIVILANTRQLLKGGTGNLSCSPVLPLTIQLEPEGPVAQKGNETLQPWGAQINGFLQADVFQKSVVFNGSSD